MDQVPSIGGGDGPVSRCGDVPVQIEMTEQGRIYGSELCNPRGTFSHVLRFFRVTPVAECRREGHSGASAGDPMSQAAAIGVSLHASVLHSRRASTLCPLTTSA